MKSVIALLIGIVLSSFAVAQDVTIPDSTAGFILEELIVKDQLAFEVVKQDSIITILKIENGNLTQKIAIYKTKDEEYQGIITRLNEIIKIRTAENADLRKENKRIRLKAGKTVLVVVAIAVLEGIALMFK